MTSAQYDLIYLQAGIDELKDYLLADDLFWPIGVSSPAGEPPFPRLTLGGLLLTRERAKGIKLSLNQETQLMKLLNKMDSVISDWRVAWTNKAAREFQMRLNMWGNFLEEYRKDPEGNVDRYSYEVRLRVMLHLLQSEAVDLDSSELDLLAGLDMLLRATLINGDFIWDDAIISAFPKDIYWYLYGELPEELS